MTKFVPELGQAAFGQPYKDHEVPEYMTALLRHIDYMLGVVMWNRQQAKYESPFDNTGNSFVGDAFEVHAYSWSDDEQPFNFKCGDLEISWYKYCGRGMSANKEIAPEYVIEIFDKCMSSLRAFDDETDRLTRGAQ